MERCERNAEVQALRLNDCYYLTSDDVETLKEIVVDVIWDGIVQDFSDEDGDDDDGTIDDDDDFSSSEEGSLVPAAYPSAPGSVRPSSTDEHLVAHSLSSSENAISSSTAAGGFLSPNSVPSSSSRASISASAAFLLSHSSPTNNHSESDGDGSESEDSLDAAIADAISGRRPDNLPVRGSSMVPGGPFTAADFDWVPDEWFSGL